MVRLSIPQGSVVDFFLCCLPSGRACSLPVCQMPSLWFTVLWFAQSLSCVWLFVTPLTVAHQAPLSMDFSSQAYWSGLTCPPPGDLANPGIEPRSPALQLDSLPSEPPGKPLWYTSWPRWTIWFQKCPFVCFGFLPRIRLLTTIFSTYFCFPSSQTLSPYPESSYSSMFIHLKCIYFLVSTNTVLDTHKGRENTVPASWSLHFIWEIIIEISCFLGFFQQFSFLLLILSSMTASACLTIF